MSTKLTGYVWDGCAASGMKLSSVAIMARLADFSNDEGVCWPSIETIARQIGAGMSTVRTAIARLEAEGWLTRKARRQGIERRAYEIALLSLEVEPDERESYELFMEKRFGDLVDRRRAKNGDNEYMAWDMTLGWIVWQQRAGIHFSTMSQQEVK